MILSHRHNFIFFHVPKCAGSSIAASLAKSLGPFDIMADTWADALANGARYNLRFYLDIFSPVALRELAVAARCYALNDQTHKYGPLYRAHQSIYRRLLAGEYAHACVDDVSKRFPQHFQQYFKFAFVRHPYSHIVSLWNWRRHETKIAIPFELFVDILADQSLPDPQKVRRTAKWEPSGWRVLASGDGIKVDFVGRLERIQADLRYVQNITGVPIDVSNLPQSKTFGAGNRWKDFHTYRTMRLTEVMYKPLFESIYN